MGGYGGRFYQWVMSNNPKPYNSFGNGSAMRVTPIGWWFENPRDLLEEAEKSSACSHNHPDGITGARAVVAAVRDCRILRQKMKDKKITKDNIHVMGIDHALLEYGYMMEIDIKMEDVINKFDETCQGTVPVSLWIISNSISFEDAIRKAVSLGADADTLGAIVGSIAEALGDIPE